MMRIDARLPVRFGTLESRRGDEALLSDQFTAASEPVAILNVGSPGHVVDCACCTTRSSAALALAALFRDRAVGQGAPFRGVVAVVGPIAAAEITAALAYDPIVSSRFKLA